MSKYDALGDFLRKQGREQIPMTFSEIERVTGTKLPSSQRYPAWWSNNTFNNVMTKVWLDAGYRTEQIDVERKRLIFRRVQKANSAQLRGLEESHRMFKHEDKHPDASSHPLIGAMKGTFTIEQDWDLTKPAMDAEELDEMDANVEKTAALIEKGLSGKRK